MGLNVRLIKKTNHYSLKNSILEGKEILKQNAPGRYFLDFLIWKN